MWGSPPPSSECAAPTLSLPVAPPTPSTPPESQGQKAFMESPWPLGEFYYYGKQPKWGGVVMVGAGVHHLLQADKIETTK